MFNNNKLRIAIISDLHIEFLDQYGKDKRQMLIHHILKQCDTFNVDLLALAGDIHSKQREYNKIIREFEQKVPDLIHVLGNHDYYQPGGELLMSDTIGVNYFKNVKIQFSTMWTDFHGNFLSAALAQTQIPDFKYIPEMKPDYMIAMNQSYRQLLIDKPNISLTHFATNVSLIASQYKNNPLNPYFVPDLHDDFITHGVKVSIYGHTHTKTFQEVDNITYINNAFGYPGENYQFIDQYEVIIIDYDPETHRVTRVN